MAPSQSNGPRAIRARNGWATAADRARSGRGTGGRRPRSRRQLDRRSPAGVTWLREVALAAEHEAFRRLLEGADLELHRPRPEVDDRIDLPLEIRGEDVRHRDGVHRQR